LVFTEKQKKSKQKAVSLQEFTASLEPTTPSAGQNVIYAPKKPMISSWADEVEEYGKCQWACYSSLSLTYVLSFRIVQERHISCNAL